jgi:hypothetical protein
VLAVLTAEAVEAGLAKLGKMVLIQKLVMVGMVQIIQHGPQQHLLAIVDTTLAAGLVVVIIMLLRTVLAALAVVVTLIRMPMATLV